MAWKQDKVHFVLCPKQGNKIILFNQYFGIGDPLSVRNPDPV